MNKKSLNRLQELLVHTVAAAAAKGTSSSNSNSNDSNYGGGRGGRGGRGNGYGQQNHYAVTIKRALKSLQDCTEPILTQKDAMQKLKYVGPAMAKKICPSLSVAAVAGGGEKGTESNKKQQQQKKKKVTMATAKKTLNNNNNNNNGGDSASENDSDSDDAIDQQQKAYHQNTTTSTSTHTTSTGTANIMSIDDRSLRLRSIPMVCPVPAISLMANGNNSSDNSHNKTSTMTAKQIAYRVAKTDAETIVLPQYGLSWKVILLIDSREHKSKQVVSSCKQVGIPCEERQLPIGDMVWIARCTIPKHQIRYKQQQQHHNSTSYNSSSCTGASTAAITKKKRKKKNTDDDVNDNDDDDNYCTIEILIGTIVERKEVSDLVSSLYGTRYAEQRLRLSQCGLPQILFLVEGNLSSCVNCSKDTLQMAMMETRIDLGFQIVQTKNLMDTVSHLKTLHARIVQRTFPDAFGNANANDRNGQKRKERQNNKQATSINEEASNDNTTNNNNVALPTFGGGNKRHGGRGERRAISLLEMVFDTPPVPPFGTDRFITYQELKAKILMDRECGTKSVRALSLAMLKQIPTLSLKKCTAIANTYPTMNTLLEALSYHNNHQDHPKNLIRNIEIENSGGINNRTVGPSSANEVYNACCTLQDGSSVLSHHNVVGTNNNNPAVEPFFKMTKKTPPSSSSFPVSSATSKPLSVIDSNKLKGVSGSITGAVETSSNSNIPKKPPKRMRTKSSITIKKKNAITDNTKTNKIGCRKRPAVTATIATTAKLNSIDHNDDDYDSDIVIVESSSSFPSPCKKRAIGKTVVTTIATKKNRNSIVDLLTPESSSSWNIRADTGRTTTTISSKCKTKSNNRSTVAGTMHDATEKLSRIVERSREIEAKTGNNDNNNATTTSSENFDDSISILSSDDDTLFREYASNKAASSTTTTKTTINIEKNESDSKNDDDNVCTGVQNKSIKPAATSLSSSKRKGRKSRSSLYGRSSRRLSLQSSDCSSSFVFTSPEEDSPFMSSSVRLKIDTSCKKIKVDDYNSDNNNNDNNINNNKNTSSTVKRLKYQDITSESYKNEKTDIVDLLDDSDDSEGDNDGDIEQNYLNDIGFEGRQKAAISAVAATAAKLAPSVKTIEPRKVFNDSSLLSALSSTDQQDAKNDNDSDNHKSNTINGGEVGDDVEFIDIGRSPPPNVTTKRGGGSGSGLLYSAESSSTSAAGSYSFIDDDDNDNNNTPSRSTNNNDTTTTTSATVFHTSSNDSSSSSSPEYHATYKKMPERKKIIQEIIELDNDNSD